MHREDFPILKENIIYFDNGATTLKPSVLAEAESEYYNHYSANAHRGDYAISLKVDDMYERTRSLVQNLIHASKKEEIIFTSGTTDSLNKIIFGYYRYHLKPKDEILITKSEHASIILPWLELADELGLTISYIPLDQNRKVTIENVEKAITEKTKVISLAHITNVVGDIRPIEQISKLAHRKNIDIVVDAAQSIGHMPIDVTKLDVDFLAFSAHKMYGPTGVGVIYGKIDHLYNIHPIIFGGGMNVSFTSEGVRVYNEIPDLLEGGTPNIAGIIAFGSIIHYLQNIKMEEIQKYEQELKKYALDKLKKIDQIIIYNENSESGIITMNYRDVFAQDLAIYLDSYHICVRAGNHCAKMVKEILDVKNTVRVSFGFYNTKEEIDQLCNALTNPNLKREIVS